MQGRMLWISHNSRRKETPLRVDETYNSKKNICYTKDLRRNCRQYSSPSLSIMQKLIACVIKTALKENCTQDRYRQARTNQYLPTPLIHQKLTREVTQHSALLPSAAQVDSNSEVELTELSTIFPRKP